MEQTGKHAGDGAEQWLADRPAASKSEGDGHRPVLGRTRKTVRFILAVDAWKKTGSNLAHRASFPLLRRVLRNEKHSIVTSEELMAYPTEVLEKSCRNHKLVMIMMMPLLLWSLIGIIRGVAYLVRFDTFTPWIGYSVPLAIFASGRLFLSYQSRKAQNRELAARRIRT